MIGYINDVYIYIYKYPIEVYGMISPVVILALRHEMTTDTAAKKLPEGFPSEETRRLLLNTPFGPFGLFGPLFLAPKQRTGHGWRGSFQGTGVILPFTHHHDIYIYVYINK